MASLPFPTSITVFHRTNHSILEYGATHSPCSPWTSTEKPINFTLGIFAYSNPELVYSDIKLIHNALLLASIISHFNTRTSQLRGFLSDCAELCAVAFAAEYIPTYSNSQMNPTVATSSQLICLKNTEKATPKPAFNLNALADDCLATVLLYLDFCDITQLKSVGNVLLWQKISNSCLELHHDARFTGVSKSSQLKTGRSAFTLLSSLPKLVVLDIFLQDVHERLVVHEQYFPPTLKHLSIVSFEPVFKDLHHWDVSTVLPHLQSLNLAIPLGVIVHADDSWAYKLPIGLTSLSLEGNLLLPSNFLAHLESLPPPLPSLTFLQLDSNALRYREEFGPPNIPNLRVFRALQLRQMRRSKFRSIPRFTPSDDTPGLVEFAYVADYDFLYLPRLPSFADGKIAALPPSLKCVTVEFGTNEDSLARSFDLLLQNLPLTLRELNLPNFYLPGEAVEAYLNPMSGLKKLKFRMESHSHRRIEALPPSLTHLMLTKGPLATSILYEELALLPTTLTRLEMQDSIICPGYLIRVLPRSLTVLSMAVDHFVHHRNDIKTSHYHSIDLPRNLRALKIGTQSNLSASDAHSWFLGLPPCLERFQFSVDHFTRLPLDIGRSVPRSLKNFRFARLHFELPPPPLHTIEKWIHNGLSFISGAYTWLHGSSTNKAPVSSSTYDPLPTIGPDGHATFSCELILSALELFPKDCHLVVNFSASPPPNTPFNSKNYEYYSNICFQLPDSLVSPPVILREHDLHHVIDVTDWATLESP